MEDMSVTVRLNVIVGPHGFCFGVNNAFKSVVERLEKKEELITDGEIVHNQNVLKKLEKLGLKYLKSAENSNIDQDVKFVVRAHGLPPSKISEFSKKYTIIDLTCPIVNNLFKLAKKLSSNGYCLVVFGKREHAEMVALLGYVEKAIVTLEPVRLEESCKKIALISQTTSSEDEFLEFINKMKKENPKSDFKVINTICKVTIERENAAKELGQLCDLVIVVGGKNSSNTKKLFSIASKYTETVHVADLNELKIKLEELRFPKSIYEKKPDKQSRELNIGIISGTSTHEEDVRFIVNYLLKNYGGRELTMSDLRNYEESFEQLLSEYENTTQVGRGKVIEGLVTEVTPTGLTVDLGSKVTGVVPLEELVRDINDYRVGDKIKVQVEKIDEESGTATLSEKKPMSKQILEEVREAYKNGKPVNGKIVDKTKGGYKVLIENTVEAFLPGSESNIRSDDVLPRVKLQFAVIAFEINGKKANVVVSRKRLQQKMIDEFFAHRKQGDVVEGIVESINEKGAVVKISGIVNGFLPNSEVSYDTSVKASHILKEGKSMKFIIKDLEPSNRKLILSLKALLPDPWENVHRKYQIGQIVTGIVTSVKPFGFFVKIEEGVEGFVPVDEIFWGKKGNINEVVSVGDGVRLQILEINPEKRQIKLSYKSVVGDPWESIDKRFSEGNIGEGKVLKVLPNGVIIEVEKNVTAFCNISELSWNFVDNVEDVIKEGQMVKFKVIEIDKENKKIRVSLRKSQENPWETFAKNHKEGDFVKAKITKILEKGYIGVCENIEVYIPKTQVNNNLILGTEIDAKIIKLEQFKDIYKVIVSPKAFEEEQAMVEIKKQSNNDNFGNVSMEVRLKDDIESETDRNN